MLNQSSIAKIKKYVGWENKPDGAIEALAELVTDCVVDPCYEQAVLDREAQEIEALAELVTDCVVDSCYEQAVLDREAQESALGKF